MTTLKKPIDFQNQEYMCKDQLRYFEQRLVEERQNIINEITKTREQLSVKDESVDPCDQAADEEIRDLNLRAVERLTKLLHKVEASLENIKSGEYGYCKVTGEEIGLPRLLARPFTSMSVQAKEAQEHLKKTEGRK